MLLAIMFSRQWWESDQVDLSQPPSESPFILAFAGLVAPTALFLLGSSNIVSQQAVLSYRGGKLSLSGANAVAEGIAILGVALLLHAHFFWAAGGMGAATSISPRSSASSRSSERADFSSSESVC